MPPDPTNADADRVSWANIRPMSDEDIETININGPYNHSQWTDGRLTVSHEEALTGRGDFLASTIRKTLLATYGDGGLAGKSLLDVGCYDGWILHQLQDLPFAGMTGVEPREKNIRKGRAIRKILGLDLRADVRVGSVDGLPDRAADIVTCLGVLHHVCDIGSAISSLCRACKDVLILETICLGDSQIDQRTVKELELKDVIYFNDAPMVGVSFQKLESSYYDGSTEKSGLVTIASLDLIRLHLQVNGFSDIEILADPGSYAAGLWKKHRPAHAVMLRARRKPHQDFEAEALDKAARYEYEMFANILPRSEIEGLLDRADGKGPVPRSFGGLKAWLTQKACFGTGWVPPKARMLLSRLCSPGEFEIRKNLRYCPRDKIRLEYAKALRSTGEFSASNDVLIAIIRTWNADWRAVYRALFLMARNHRSLGDVGKAAECEGKCLTCHAEFPLTKLNQQLDSQNL